MTCEAFIEHRFSKASRATIDAANGIILECIAQGFILALRQLSYQFVHAR